MNRISYQWGASAGISKETEDTMGSPDSQVQTMWGWPKGCTEWPTKALASTVRRHLLWWGTCRLLTEAKFAWITGMGLWAWEKACSVTKAATEEVIVCRRPWCREELILHPSETSPVLIWQYCKYKLVKFTQQVRWVLWHNPGRLVLSCGLQFPELASGEPWLRVLNAHEGPGMHCGQRGNTSHRGWRGEAGP